MWGSLQEHLQRKGELGQSCKPDRLKILKKSASSDRDLEKRRKGIKKVEYVVGYLNEVLEL